MKSYLKKFMSVPLVPTITWYVDIFIIWIKMNAIKSLCFDIICTPTKKNAWQEPSTCVFWCSLWSATSYIYQHLPAGRFYTTSVLISNYHMHIRAGALSKHKLRIKNDSYICVHDQVDRRQKLSPTPIEWEQKEKQNFPNPTKLKEEGNHP